MARADAPGLAWRCAWILAAGCCAAGPVSSHAKEMLPLWEAGIGLGYTRLPDYRGSDEAHGYVLPFPLIVYRGDFFNRPVLYNPYQHIAQQFVTLAEAVGSTDVPTVKRLVSQSSLRLPPLLLQPGELDAARDALGQRHASIANRPLVFLCPGAGLLPIRAWPVESFSTVARHFVEQGYAVAIVGVAADREVAQRIQQDCQHAACIDLTGYTKTMRDVAVLLHLGVLLITNDGGTGHIASLTPISSIVLFGPETPMLYGTLSPRAVNLYKPLSCSPCLTAYNHQRSPCDGNNVCLKSISPQEVLVVANDLIHRAQETSQN